MAIRSAALAFAALALAACQPAQQPIAAAPPAAQPQAAQPDPNAEPLDPFVVMIGAERWTVLLDKATEGTREAPAPAPAAIDETDQARADRATRDAAAMLLILRNQQCAKGHLKGDDCTIANWPAWASEPPNPNTPLATIDERSGWVGETMQKYVDKGCELGKAALKDEMFCSVE